MDTDRAAPRPSALGDDGPRASAACRARAIWYRITPSGVDVGIEDRRPPRSAARATSSPACRSAVPRHGHCHVVGAPPGRAAGARQFLRAVSEHAGQMPSRSPMRGRPRPMRNCLLGFEDRGVDHAPGDGAVGHRVGDAGNDRQRLGPALGRGASGASRASSPSIQPRGKIRHAAWPAGRNSKTGGIRWMVEAWPGWRPRRPRALMRPAGSRVRHILNRDPPAQQNDRVRVEGCDPSRPEPSSRTTSNRGWSNPRSSWRGLPAMVATRRDRHGEQRWPPRHIRQFMASPSLQCSPYGRFPGGGRLIKLPRDPSLDGFMMGSVTAYAELPRPGPRRPPCWPPTQGQPPSSSSFLTGSGRFEVVTDPVPAAEVADICDARRLFPGDRRPGVLQYRCGRPWPAGSSPARTTSSSMSGPARRPGLRAAERQAAGKARSAGGQADRLPTRPTIALIPSVSSGGRAGGRPVRAGRARGGEAS